jgi:hypothetical protein
VLEDSAKKRTDMKAFNLVSRMESGRFSVNDDRDRTARFGSGSRATAASRVAGKIAFRVLDLD